jgi:PAS domain S-box-containing protein
MVDPANGGRERSFQALRESEELHRVVLGNISDAVFLADDEGRFTFVCPNVDIIFGYLPDEVYAMGRLDRLLGEGLFDGARLAADGEIRNIEREVSAKSGVRRSLLVHVKKVAIQGGTVLCTCRDVTERRTAEDEVRAARADLAHASRLTLVGELIASIVHEIRQPLASMSANAAAGIRVLEGGRLADEPEMLREILADIYSQAHAADEVIQRLRSLVRKQALALEVLDVNEVLSDLLRLVGGEAQMRGVSLRSELESRALKVHADRVSLHQVVLNLLVNAMDAVKQADRERLVIVRTRDLRDSVEISVSDSGPGIPADHATRIFDAFFTTKRDGVGLGLAVARSLVQAQGGQLSFVDRVERGATFRVTLPAHWPRDINSRPAPGGD